jgi:putative FmdB family regulatory protein
VPTYEYECLKCGHNFEMFQMMSDSPIKSCPKCKGKVRRLIGAGSGIIFKGPGFYATDYRKSRPSQGAGEENSQKSCSQDRVPKGSSSKNCPSKQGEGK